MPTTTISGFLRRLTRGMAAETLTDRPDHEIIQGFLARADEALFEVLVRRHGPMVYRVCWRVLHHCQNTEDAFQATFLVLAQKLRSVRKRDSLASWLHGVAHRVALKVKEQTARRSRHERGAAVTEAVPPDDITWKEFHTALDAELTRLPENLRLPLILCYLEGRTQEEAASQLGWSKSTLLRRLEEARTALGRRLTRRGVVWPAALSAVLFSDCVILAALPSELIGSTVEAAAAVAAGKTAAVTVVSAKVVALTKGVLKTMFLTKYRMAAAMLAAATLACISAGILAHIAPAPGPAKEIRSERASPAPADRYGDPLPAGAVARMGTARLRHGSSVFFVTFLPDGKQVLSAGEDGLARLWDVATGKEVRRFGNPHPMPEDWRPGHSPPAALAVALSPDSKTLATSDGDAKVRLWDTATGLQKGEVKGLKIDVAALALSPDGKTLAVAGDDGTVLLCDLSPKRKQGELDVRRLEGPASDGHDMNKLFPDDSPQERKIIARGFVTGVVSRIRKGNGPAGGGQGIWNERLKPHLAFSADGKTLLSATLRMPRLTITGDLKVWNVASGKELCHVDPGDEAVMVAAALSPDGKIVAWTDQTATGGGTVHVMETATGKEMHRLPAGGTAYNLGVGKASGKLIARFPGAGTRFAFAPDGRTLVTRATGGQVVVWDVATGKELHRRGKPLPPPTWWGGISTLSHPGLAVSPDGKTLAVAGDGNAVTLLDLNTGEELHARVAPPAAITAVRYTSDGKALTSLGSDGGVRTWDAATGKETSVASVPQGTLTSALSANGQVIASAGLDGRVRLTEAATGKERGTISTSLRGPLRMAFAPDAKTLAVGGSASAAVRLYDIGTGKEARTLKPPEEKEDAHGPMIIPFRPAPAPVFSLDGKLLAAPGRSVLHVWAVATGEEVRRFALPQDRAVGGAVFAPDGRTVALDMQDGTVALWELATGKRVRVFESGPLRIPATPPGGPPGRAVPLAPVDPALLAFSPDGGVLVHSHEREVAVWDVGSGKVLARLKGHGGAVLAGAFAPDGHALATASADTTVLVWNRKSGEW